MFKSDLLHDDNELLPHINMLTAATGYLKACYAPQGCRYAGYGVVHHLKLLISHPNFDRFSNGSTT